MSILANKRNGTTKQRAVVATAHPRAPSAARAGLPGAGRRLPVAVAVALATVPAPAASAADQRLRELLPATTN